MEIHLLDMGTVKFGDCILITNGDRKILIDGGHPSDGNSIRMQLKKLLRQDPPFEVDLLVVTHCHSDHIGCLPDLIKIEDLKPKKALLADEKLGFGSLQSDEDAVSDAAQTLNVALDEEDHSDLDGEELDQFLYDAANLQSKYHDMVKQLKSTLGDDAMIFTGIEDGYEDLEKEFKDFGLKILGPTREHIKICASKLSKTKKSASTTDAGGIDPNDFDELGAAYKNLVSVQLNPPAGDVVDAEDMAGPGAAKNDQSIVIKVKAGNLSALLPGDMQFGKAEVAGLNDLMSDLLTHVNEEGPYDFIKFAHHTSYNGLGDDGAVLEEWLKSTSLYAHSGGLRDPSHPDPNMLKFIKQNKEYLNFARTDRNGIITVRNIQKPEMLISKGDFNNFSVNKKEADDIETGEENKAPVVAPSLPVPVPVQYIQQGVSGVIEISAKIPYEGATVTFTIEIDKKKVQ